MQNLFNTKTYTAENLISLLLPKLQQRGITKITEEELSRDLYHYSKHPKFEDLFIDIGTSKTGNSLDIYNAMFIEKYIAGAIKWDDMRPTKLFLAYPHDLDFSYDESLLTDEGLLLVNTIADELSIKYKVKSTSKNKMVIYNVNPNQSYTLVHGNNRLALNVSWDLVTDGQIKSSEQVEMAKSFSYKRPRNINENTKLNNAIIRNIEIENANYVIVQGFEDDVIKSLEVYTTLTDLESLQQISKIANDDHIENVELLVEDRPIVKKIILS